MTPTIHLRERRRAKVAERTEKLDYPSGMPRGDGGGAPGSKAQKTLKCYPRWAQVQCRTWLLRPANGSCTGRATPDVHSAACHPAGHQGSKTPPLPLRN